MELREAFGWMEKLIALAVVLQSIELLAIRKTFASDGIWPWSIVRGEFEGLPGFMLRLLDGLMEERGLVLVLLVRLGGALVGLFFPHPLLWGYLFASTLLVCMRWRGTFNGGSDYMTLIVLMAALVGRSFFDETRVVAVSLGYVALQACLSYFVAGLVKLKKAEWRAGLALGGFLSSSYYGVPAWLGAAMRNRWLAISASWALISFECLFPVALTGPQAASILIAVAAIFHLVNVYAFGLNRFLWAWASAYPAVLGCAAWLSRT